MKRTRSLIAGLLLAAGIGGVAFAQGGGKPGGCDGMGPMGMGPMSGQGGPAGKQAGMKFDPAQRAERHLTMLKGQLKISAEQEPLWQAYAEKMKGEAGKGMRAMRDTAAAPQAALSAPERMAKMQAVMEERVAAMRDVHEHFNRLYAVLTPEQQATADQFAARMGPSQGQGRRGAKGAGKSGQGQGPGRMAAPQG